MRICLSVSRMHARRVGKGRPHQSECWLRNHWQRAAKSVFEQGLGLFGSPVDAALLDEVVSMAYEERRRPADLPESEFRMNS